MKAVHEGLRFQLSLRSESKEGKSEKHTQNWKGFCRPVISIQAFSSRIRTAKALAN